MATVIESMNRNTLTGARSAVVLVGLGLLLAACSARVGGTASAPADSVAATPAATAAGTAGAPASVAPSAAPASVPTTNPLAPSVVPLITLTTPSPPATRPAAPTPRPAVATPTPTLEPPPTPAPRGPTPAPTGGANRQIGEPDNGHSVVVPVGAEVTLVLHNIYWQVQGSSDPAVLALVSGPVISGAGPIACIPGSGCGTVTAVFRAVAPGRATITASRTSCGETLQCIGTAGAYEVTVVAGS